MTRVLLSLLLLVSCNTGDGFRWNLGPEWKRQAIVNGFQYTSPAGSLTLKVFNDELMDETVLFSRQTWQNIRENYEETYVVGDDHVYFSELEIDGRRALVVFFADRSSGEVVHRRQYYLVDGHRVFLLAGVVGALSSVELDGLAGEFHIR